MKAKADFKEYNADSDEAAPLKDKYAIQSLPTVIYMDGGGKELQRTNGFGTPEAFKEFIAQVGGSAR